MRTVTSIVMIIGLLATAALAVGAEPAPVAVIVPPEHAASFVQTPDAQYLYAGYSSSHSAYSAGPCAAPPYGMDDMGTGCNHWRNSCCDNAWAGYCNETGLFGYRTYRDRCHSGCCGGCGGHLFSLFRWSQPTAECEADDCQPAPQPVSSPPTEAPKSPEA